MSNSLNERALLAGQDDREREKFIRDSEQIILRIASKTTQRYVTKSDDEWSVALYAFSKAVDGYDETKGDFTGYAAVAIKRALIDHYRRQKKYSAEISFDPASADEYEENTDDGGAGLAIARESEERFDEDSREQDLHGEITEINALLKNQYGFTFFDIAEESPKQDKTKKECAKAVCCILDNKELLGRVKAAGTIPIKELVRLTGISKKIPERYRKYILMAVTVLSGEYPLLRDYLEYMRKEGAS